MEEMINAVMGVQERLIKRRINLDVIAIFVAWGLELNESMQEVGRIIKA